MRYKKLTHTQRRIHRWMVKRNIILNQILLADKAISTEDAMRLANKRAGRRP